MGERQEYQPLLGSADRQDGDADRLERLDRRQSRQSIVSFHERDSGNPLEWSQNYKWSSVGLLCMSGAVVTFTCIGIVPVAGDVVEDLKGHKDRSAAVLFVTIWEVGEAMGPLFVGPLSELFGRFVVYNVANCLFILSVTLTALSRNIDLLIFTRFMTGCAVASNVLNPAIIGDMFPSESRGAAMSAVMMAPLIGGTLGPTISGPLAEAVGWRGVVWLCVAVASVIEILFITMFRETYHPTILKRRAAQKRRETGDNSYTTEYEEHELSASSKLWQSMLRPAQIMWSSSMLQCLSLWGGVMFAFIYVNSTSLPEILEVIYGFSPSKRGLSYLAWSFGSVIGIFTCNRGMDTIFNELGKRHGKFYPEGRLPLVIAGAFILPLAIALYGWAAELHTCVFVFLGTVPLLCISVVFSIVPMMTFITDTFGKYSASAVTALLVPRCLMGAFLPLIVPPLTDAIGYGWAFTVMAAVALALAPIPCLVMRYGPTWRQKSEYTKDK